MGPKHADRMANSVDSDQDQPDLGLHCLPRKLKIITVVRATDFSSDGHDIES